MALQRKRTSRSSSRKRTFESEIVEKSFSNYDEDAQLRLRERLEDTNYYSKGRLQLSILSAEIETKPSKIFFCGPIDPYVEFSYRGLTFKTVEDENGG